MVRCHYWNTLTAISINVIRASGGSLCRKWDTPQWCKGSAFAVALGTAFIQVPDRLRDPYLVIAPYPTQSKAKIMHYSKISPSVPAGSFRRAIAVSCFCGLTLMAFPGCHKPEEVAKEEPVMKSDQDSVTMPVDAPQHATLVVELARPVAKTSAHVTGRLVWNEETTVRVFSSVAGRVNQINAVVGQRVSEGDTLARMASVDFGQAQADASKAEADLKLSERTLTRQKDLFEHGAAAKKEVEAAEDDFENRKAERARAYARLKLYGVEGGSVDGMFPLKAPISGVVVEKSINPGQEVRSDMMLANDIRLVQPLFVISSPSRLTAILDVTELETSALKAGQEIEVTSRAYPGQVFHGKLELIGGSIDPTTRTVKARGYVDNPDGLLKAEMYVSIGIAIKPADQVPPPLQLAETAIGGKTPASATAPVEISSKAVFLKDNRHFVFVEKEPGKYQRKPVEVGVETEGRICVTNGLFAGEKVVVQGCLLLEAVTEGIN